MTEVSVSAPGKLLLCGEYAVLRNAPAVVMAVDRRAVARVSPGDAPWHTLTTPGFSDRTWRFELDDGNRVSWLDESPEASPELAAAVISEAAVALGASRCIEIDTAGGVECDGGIRHLPRLLLAGPQSVGDRHVDH